MIQLLFRTRYKMSLNIYFCGSIHGGRQDANLYARIIKQLQEYGEVLTEHVGKVEIEKEAEKLDAKFIHDRDIDWLETSNVVVAEVTQPSLGVGYEIGRAVAMKKKILCLYRPTNPGKKLSCMIRGAHDGDSIKVFDYKEEELPKIFKDYFAAL
ncbi:putative 2'-deoxynucleoside 5'-phosphate N-hydrolase 1 [Saccoglossus kowalevskii]|uniref:Putative 2'-deoxynucleoside 5'-phosphate N-hydrolase 1 n=1 Tax=Saccoglossus kowalevskii TaxID=10224 RepID=A0ABM0MXV4_SACKO|nr:PREDICTED: putative 2'-deoxynucleoside 5'-phosphate N-hydrolase 1-like [Saccoglossus kowalevskii]